MTYLKDNGDEDIIPVLNSLGTEPESPAIKMRLYEKYICKEYSGDTMSEIDEAITCFSSQITYDEKNFLMADILSCIAIYGASPEEYFEFGFTGLNHLGRSEFLCDKQRFVLFRPFYDFNHYEMVRNKWNQYTLLRDFFKRECIHVDDNTKESDIQEFLSRHETFVIKPARAFHGDGVKIINHEQTDIASLLQELKGKEFVFDELISQHDYFKRLHPESMNTVRALALQLGDETVILHPQLHIGRGKSVADNDLASIRANINADDGIVYTPGFDHYKKMFICHPDTGVQIVGLKIPDYQALKEFVAKAMNELIGLAGFIGFDLAYTDNGWVIVEINPFPQVYSQQLIDRRGYRKEFEQLARQKG